MEKAINKAEKVLLSATIFLLPLVVLWSFPNPLVTPKIILIGIFFITFLALKIVKIISSGKLQVPVSTYDFPVLLMGIAFLASAILKTPNKMEAFFIPGDATVIIGAIAAYFLINGAGKTFKRSLLDIIFISGVTFSVVTLLSFSGIFSKIPQLPAFIKDPLFNPTGSAIAASILLVSILPIGVINLLGKRDVAKKFFYAVSTTIVAFGLAVSIFHNFSPAPTLFPGFKTTWFVAIDSLKESPLLGMGPGNYLTAFNKFRPISFNQTASWNLRFGNAQNFYLTVITETGFVGVAALILLFTLLYKSVKSLFADTTSNSEKVLIAPLAVLMLVFFAFSPSISAIFLLFVLLAINAQTRIANVNLSPSNENQTSTSKIATILPAVVISVPLIAMAVFVGIYTVKATLAEYDFSQAIADLNKNDAVSTYNSVKDAIALNPYVDRYHIGFAQVNLAIAQNLAQKQDLSDDDKNTLAQLIQQAISEAKAAVYLNDQRAGNWETLAAVYRSVVPFAQNSSDFAIQSYNAAITYDPINPNTRISLGGIYYALGDYESAIEVFKYAAMAKPDLANAHYNLAIAYRENGKIDNAISEMTAVLSLVDKDSQDYQTAKAELDNLEKNKPQATSQTSDNLTPPTTVENGTNQTQIQLPEEAAPPTPEEIATPQPTATPTPTLTPTPTPGS